MSQYISGEKEAAATTDGRNISSELGALSGEASQQGVRSTNGAAVSVWRGRTADEDIHDPTYYDRPMLKRSVWSIDVPLYYYVGGVSGACAVLGAAAQLAGKKEYPALTHRGRWVSTAGGALSTFLLIHDLGRPTRFLYMMRVFRPSSPMNVGAWVLAAFAPMTTASAVIPFLDNGLTPWGDAMALAAGPLGAVLAGYTGVLISNTAVPVWSAGRRIMPLLFLSSSGVSAAAMLEFMDLNRHEQRAMRRFGAIAAASDLACSFALEREVSQVPQAAAPLQKGFSGFLWNTAKVLTAISLGLFLWPKRTKGARRARAIVGTAAGLTLRFAVHYAGEASADDPRASFHQQRAGKGAAEVTGKAAVTGPDTRKKKAALADGLSVLRQNKQSVKK